MKNKYFYPIFKLKAKSWIRYWLLKKTEFKGKLSEILEGFSFNLQNTLKQKFVKFEILGNSIQDGEPIKSAGENVNINSSELEPGSIANGNNYESNDNIRSKDYISVQPSTNYAFSIDGTLNRVVVSMYDENKNFLNTSGTEGYISSNGLFTTYSNAKYIRYRCYNADKTLFQNGKIKIEPGSIATPWSPYGMGSITDKIVNKNILEITENSTLVHCSYVSGANTNQYNLQCTAVDMYVNLQQPSGSSYNKRKNGNLIPCEYGETIYFDVGNPLFTGCYFTEYDKNLKSLGFHGTNSPNGTYTPKNANCKYVTFRFGYGSNATPGTTYTLAPIISNTPINSYVPHEEQTYSIYTQQPFRSIGDVRDCFVKKSDGWYERHYIGEVILNGTENIARELISNNVYKFYINNIENVDYRDANYVPQILCNKLIAVARTPMYLNTQGISSGNGNLQIYTDETKNMTVSEFKTWLENNNLIVNYLKTIPIYLPCTLEQIQQLENRPITYEGQTNVYSTDEVEPYLKIQYWESDTNG